MRRADNHRDAMHGVSMHGISIDAICKNVIELTNEVGDFILKEKNKFTSADVQKKGFNDLVSYVDKNSEKKLIKGLQKILPGSGVLAEEGGGSFDSKYTWVIDPLDGTTNFIHKLPCFAISIALFVQMDPFGKNKTPTPNPPASSAGQALKGAYPVLGVVNELNFKECFSAIKGKGAKLNGKKIHVSTQKKLEDSLIATGFPYNDFGLQQEYMQLFAHLMRVTQGIRRIGSASADLCYVAMGRFEAFYEYGLKPWDVSAGALIVQEAGGNLSDFEGGNDYFFGRSIVATNGHLHKPFMTIIKKYFSGEMNKLHF